MRRKDDPIYYKEKIVEWINKAEENGIKVEYTKDELIGDYIIFSDIGTKISIPLKRFEKKEVQK